MGLERFSTFAVIVAAHLGLLGWLISGPDQQPPMLAAPVIQGVLIITEAPPSPVAASPEPELEPEPKPATQTHASAETQSALQSLDLQAAHRRRR